MARGLARASSQNLTPAGLSNYSTQVSIGMWFRPASAPGSGVYMTHFAKGVSGNAAQRNVGCDYRDSGSGDWLEIYWTVAQGTYIEYRTTSTVSLTNGTWYHLLWVVDWATNPDTVVLYLDGVSQALTNAGGTDTVPQTAGTQVARIGSLHQDSSYLDGDLAEFFICTNALTAAEAILLSRGFSPLFLGSRTFDAYYPLIGRASPEIDRKLGNTATVTGATAAAHPRIYHPSAPFAPYRTVAAGGATWPGWLHSRGGWTT